MLLLVFFIFSWMARRVICSKRTDSKAITWINARQVCFGDHRVNKRSTCVSAITDVILSGANTAIDRCHNK